MKAVLEFNLPEDSEDYNSAINGQKAFAALDDIRQLFRNISKYESFPDIEVQRLLEKEEVAFVLDKLEDHFFEILSERGIKL